jgi:hypothetical protein
VSTRTKPKIRYNGREYSHPSALPPEIRAAYYSAMTNDAGAGSTIWKRKLPGHRRSFDHSAHIPADVRGLYEDVMSVIESNGEVTLPRSQDQRLVTKRHLVSAALVAGAVVAIVWAAFGTH